MFKVILIPIDIANTAAAAPVLALARQLSGQGGRLILLNVVEDLPGHIAPFIPGEVYKEAVPRAQGSLAQLAKDHDLPSDTEVLVREGHAPTTILEVAQESGADAIVVASHDPGLADFFLGSVAARVVRHAHCSVLVVRNVTA